MRSILNIFFTGRDLAATFSISLSLAQRFRAYVEGHLVFPPELVPSLCQGQGAEVIYSDGTENLEDGKVAATHIGNAFRSIATAYGCPYLGQGGKACFGASWTFEPIRDVASICIYAAGFDLIVAEPPSGSRRRTFTDFLKSVLQYSGRPVLIASRRPVLSCGERIAVSWTEGPELPRLVGAMLPLLAKAEEVTILCARTAQDYAGLDQFTEYLFRHQIVARIERLGSSAVSSAVRLLDEANELRADLLMVGYSRPSWLARILKGDVLAANVEIPMPIMFGS